MYSEKVLDHFHHPRNQGKMKAADGIGQVGNPVCGDIMKIYIKVGQNADSVPIIEDIKFETLGCGAAIATSSMLTEMAKGKTIDEALKIGKLEIAQELGGLPEAKLHCSILAHDGLKAAVADYRQNKNKS
ncbi:MAG TPA: iron-sulfur cluster assembly scaffold protein [bacterium]|nr:iron-sulfur cluster assembly scaffold protein [bacterium]HNS33832.1 iron-sulfur cluster assembly scaffold protein [bacterium]HNZ73608.1 iron-sulfur cluster assembly scaffold protein [bacterium]HOH67467.1 iron-sulfur cluster assembly scaffold protein [bacterium]HQA64029.1 iron-sulfur cluster assembly scaffold protein [bacterium]